jgi:hypothetical protein
VLADLQERLAHARAQTEAAVGLRQTEPVQQPQPEGRTSARQRPQLEALREVRSTGLARLLDFQEALSLVDGVESVAVVDAGDESARFVVELVRSDSPGGTAGDPTRVCAWCGKLIAVGGPQLSHGLCEECAARMRDI